VNYSKLINFSAVLYLPSNCDVSADNLTWMIKGGQKILANL